MLLLLPRELHLLVKNVFMLKPPKPSSLAFKYGRPVILQWNPINTNTFGPWKIGRIKRIL